MAEKQVKRIGRGVRKDDVDLFSYNENNVVERPVARPHRADKNFERAVSLQMRRDGEWSMTTRIMNLAQSAE